MFGDWSPLGAPDTAQQIHRLGDLVWDAPATGGGDAKKCGSSSKHKGIWLVS